MKVSEVRERYLEFFKKRGHAIIPSAPIVPENDPTTLFTSSGMQPLVPYLLGQPHPLGFRIADSQLSFRAQDIEEVGDNRHTTFFEMLGNWSLGDYFKKEQLPWFFEFLTDELRLDPDKLYVTVFAGDEALGIPKDDESIEIWKELFIKKRIEAKDVVIGSEENGYEIGMQGARIFAYDAKKNWWSRSGTPDNMPAGEPGGPDSEVFYDFGTPHDPKWGKECHPNCDCGRFMEIGNSVFMEYLKKENGFEKLPKANVDFGGGLERLTAAIENEPDIFRINIFDWIRTNLEKVTGKKYGDDAEITRAFRIILDHVRAALFIMAAGVKPSNTEQGYVLRRLLRRSMLFINRLKADTSDSFFSLGWIIESFVNAYKDTYPHLVLKQLEIQELVIAEENMFDITLRQGIRELEKMGTDIDPFVLFTTYGFPIELTAEIANEKGITINLENVRSQMQEHQALSRAGAAQKFAGGLADHAEQTVKYHTAHHLLLKALQMVLGPDVHQRGSNITSERLRIDFAHGAKMTPEEIKRVEEIVNQKIKEALPVIRTEMPKGEAEKLGAEHEFGANYPELVSVYSVGPLESAYSIEFCGGPHVGNTSELGAGGKRFKVVKEEASSAGVRRIKAVLE